MDNHNFQNNYTFFGPETDPENSPYVTYGNKKLEDFLDCKDKEFT